VSEATIRGLALSIVVPAYNESGGINATVEHLLQITARLGLDVEIIIVNDCSADDTGARIDALAEKHVEISSIHHRRNRGFGAAVRTGALQARKPLVLTCPADYPFTEEDFHVYLSLSRYADIVIGYRRMRRLRLPLYHRIISSTYHALINLTFSLNFFDVNWIHMYRREPMYDWLGASDGVFFLAETLIRAQRRNTKIVGVDVGFIDRETGTATGIRPRTILTTIKDVQGAFFHGLSDVDWQKPEDRARIDALDDVIASAPQSRMGDD